MLSTEEIITSGVSHSDGSCVLGRIHSDVSSNIPKKVYHIVTDNFVNLLDISYAWLYKTECWGREFHAFSFNSHRNCKIFMTNFNFIFDTICVPYIFQKSIFGWNCDHDTPLCDTPLLEDTPICDTPDDKCVLSTRDNIVCSLLKIALYAIYWRQHCWLHVPTEDIIIEWFHSRSIIGQTIMLEDKQVLHSTILHTISMELHVSWEKSSLTLVFCNELSIFFDNRVERKLLNQFLKIHCRLLKISYTLWSFSWWAWYFAIALFSALWFVCPPEELLCIDEHLTSQVSVQGPYMLSTEDSILLKIAL